MRRYAIVSGQEPGRDAALRGRAGRRADPDGAAGIAREERSFYSALANMQQRTLAVAFVILCLSGCDKKSESSSQPERGAPPPPIESSKPGVCSGGGGTMKDAVSAPFFARTAGDYCIDPNGEARAYGDRAPANLDKVCTELFDGECEVYKSFGLKRVVTLRYVDGKGSPGAVNVNLSEFASKDGAYAFFTKRVVADSDPVEAAPKKLDAGGMAAMGTGIAYVWRGQHVVELSYTNEVEAPLQVKQSADRVIPPIAKSVGEKLPGDKEPPKAVAALPSDHLVPLGVSYTTGDVLDVTGVGGGAVGFYKDGAKRWRVVAMVRSDEDGAKDVLKTLKKVEGQQSVKGQTFDALQYSRRADDSSPKIGWVAGRKGSLVFAVGDEEHVLSNDQSALDQQKVSLSEADKLERLKKLLEPSP
jgi:Family of unknown function (DUF6599)